MGKVKNWPPTELKPFNQLQKNWHSWSVCRTTPQVRFCDNPFKDFSANGWSITFCDFYISLFFSQACTEMRALNGWWHKMAKKDVESHKGGPQYWSITSTMVRCSLSRNVVHEFCQFTHVTFCMMLLTRALHKLQFSWVTMSASIISNTAPHIQAHSHQQSITRFMSRYNT